MKQLPILLASLFLTFTTYAQELSQLSFVQGNDFSYFTVRTDQDVLIRISPEGKILEWGTEVRADFGNFYAPKLQPFLGRIEYYGKEADSAYQGKVKSIGSCYITYFDHYGEADKQGKLKTMGNLSFDYFSSHDEKSLQGKLNRIGNSSIDFYRSYEDASVRGKLKAIGNMPITYYSVFDDKFNAGKLKSVGPTQYAWYSQYDRAAGALKVGNYRQAVGGILIVLQ